MKFISAVELSVMIVFSIFTYYFFKILSFEGKPNVSDNYCWGRDETCKNDRRIFKFEINIQTEELDDLMHRLNTTRKFTPSLTNTQHQYGLDGQILEVIIKFIKEEYNFTERLEFLNKYPQFITNIQGLNMHFLHIKPKNRRRLPVVPILLLHGWPSSVREYYQSIPVLMSEDHHQFVIELVIPSLPGFGYSDGPSKPECRTVHIANMMKLLMERLGYKEFLVHGSDWGAVVAINLATLYPEKVTGLHSNFCFSFRIKTFLKLIIGALYPPSVVEKKYQSKLYPLMDYARFLFAESGYFHILGTKPDTMGHILDNTPIGLITFVFEKLTVGKNRNNIYLPSSGLESFHLTELLDIVLYYYWFPKKGVTSSRLYCENTSVRGLLEGLHNTAIDAKVPCACAFFEDEFLFTPRSLLNDKFTNLVQYNTYPGIGHFAGLEANDVLTKDILSFVNKLFNSTMDL